MIPRTCGSRKNLAAVTMAAGLLSVATVACGEVTLELTPHRVTEQPEEGPPVTSLRFPDPPGHVLYTPPPEWKVTSQNGTILLTPTHPTGAVWRIESLDARNLPPLPSGRPHDRQTLELYSALAMQLLPDRATAAKTIATDPSLIVVDNAHALEVRIRFELNGRSFLLACIHLPHRQQQVRFTLTAPERDFETLYRSARASLFTWQWIAPQSDPSTTTPDNQPPQ